MRWLKRPVSVLIRQIWLLNNTEQRRFLVWKRLKWCETRCLWCKVTIKLASVTCWYVMWYLCFGLRFTLELAGQPAYLCFGVRSLFIPYPHVQSFLTSFHPSLSVVNFSWPLATHPDANGIATNSTDSVSWWFSRLFFKVVNNETKLISPFRNIACKGKRLMHHLGWNPFLMLMYVQFWRHLSGNISCLCLAGLELSKPVPHYPGSVLLSDNSSVSFSAMISGLAVNQNGRGLRHPRSHLQLAVIGVSAWNRLGNSAIWPW